MDFLTLERWSPYLVGVGIGILSWLSFLLSDHTIGCSTSFVRTAGMIERLFRGRKVLDKPYFQKNLPAVTWDWMLVIGVLIGAFISARLSGSFRVEAAPALWAATFGGSPWLRWAFALIGGVLMGVGARWAGGCTSGHGISGTLQLALSSWLAVMGMFASGIATALVMFYLIA